MLQNVLNLLSSSSKLKHYKTSGKSEQEFQQMLQTHTPLKVDGIFEEKTEACVIKFQKHKQYKPENGIVEDSLWQIMLIDADAISNLTTGTTNHNPDETKKAKTQVTSNIPPQNSANKDSS
jgi:peptidoglycan hydrolase-like protein with peptidoglycan-binding domain